LSCVAINGALTVNAESETITFLSSYRFISDESFALVIVAV